jgi:glycosyltransferase involved in cell wall biosynthesis
MIVQNIGWKGKPLNHCKVSVCIPTYNYGNYISETIESILAQNFTDFELLIIDDCSNDQTAHIVESYAKQDPRITFLVNEVNLGMVENWNLCLAKAKGEYIKFVFGDDLLASPDTLGRMSALLDGDASISLVCSSRSIINESSQHIKVESSFETNTMVGTDVINQCMANQLNFIGEPSVVMFRKSQARRGFNPKYKQIVDLEMWFYLLEQGSFAYINEPLCSFRIHGQQQTAKNKETRTHIKDFYYLLDEYLHKDYIKISDFMKIYLKYDNLYEIWKLYKKNIMSREAVTELVSTDKIYLFFIWYPFYKSFKPFFKQYKKITNRLKTTRVN